MTDRIQASEVTYAPKRRERAPISRSMGRAFTYLILFVGGMVMTFPLF